MFNAKFINLNANGYLWEQPIYNLASVEPARPRRGELRLFITKPSFYQYQTVIFSVKSSLYSIKTHRPAAIYYKTCILLVSNCDF